MKLGMDAVDVEDGGRMWKRGEEVVEAPYPAPKPYSVLDLNQTGSPIVTGCGESVCGVRLCVIKSRREEVSSE
jgi:hypothetical protein